MIFINLNNKFVFRLEDLISIRWMENNSVKMTLKCKGELYEEILNCENKETAMEAIEMIYKLILDTINNKS